MRNTPTRDALLCAALVMLLGSLAPAQQASDSSQNSPAPAQADQQPLPGQGARYSNMCGAYSVFVASALHKSPVPLSVCAKVVPAKPAGNTMAELKRGFEQLGFAVNAYAIQPSVFAQRPGTYVVWIPPSMEIRTPSGKSFTSGHYVVLYQKADKQWLLLDYPVSARIINPETWVAAILSEFQLDELPALFINGKANATMLDTLAQNTHTLAPSNEPGQAQKTTNESMQTGRGVPDAGIATADLTIDGKGKSLAQTSLNFGSRVQGQLLEGVVWIWNDSDTTLELDNIQTTCGCTVGSLDKTTLKPDERVKLKVNMSLVGRSGLVRQSVTMVAKHEDISTPVFVECAALSAQQWTTYPASVAFGDISNDNVPHTKQIVVKASFPKIAARLVNAKTNTTGLSATILKTQSIPAKGIYTIEVTFIPNKHMSAYFSNQIFLYADPDEYAMPELTLPVTAHIK